jgi:hypothetical protein
MQPYIQLRDEEAKEISDILETILEEKKSDSDPKNDLIFKNS